jgi:hypothetical protein
MSRKSSQNQNVLSQASLRRKTDTRDPRKTYLIVCEGQTEEHYFKALCGSRTNVTVTRDGDTCPKRIADFAIGKINEFDAVICVFDKEFDISNHPKFEAAKQKLLSKKHRGKTVIAAWTVPKFEFWFILHFEMTTAAFSKNEDVDQLLKKQNGFEADEKPFSKAYEKLSHKTGTAISNAKKLQETADKEGFSNPLTNVHAAVEFLLKEFSIA